jgi:hypothetical protein
MPLSFLYRTPSYLKDRAMILKTGHSSLAHGDAYRYAKLEDGQNCTQKGRNALRKVTAAVSTQRGVIVFELNMSAPWLKGAPNCPFPVNSCLTAAGSSQQPGIRGSSL